MGMREGLPCRALRQDVAAEGTSDPASHRVAARQSVENLAQARSKRPPDSIGDPNVHPATAKRGRGFRLTLGKWFPFVNRYRWIAGATPAASPGASCRGQWLNEESRLR